MKYKLASALRGSRKVLEPYRLPSCKPEELYQELGVQVSAQHARLSWFSASWQVLQLKVEVLLI